MEIIKKEKEKQFEHLILICAVYDYSGAVVIIGLPQRNLKKDVTKRPALNHHRFSQLISAHQIQNLFN